MILYYMECNDQFVDERGTTRCNVKKAIVGLHRCFKHMTISFPNAAPYVNSFIKI